MGHKPGVVDKDVQPSVRLHGPVHESLDLIASRHICLNDRPFAEPKVGGDRLKAINPPCAQDKPRSVRREPSRGGLAEPAARARDDDDLVLDALHHACSRAE